MEFLFVCRPKTLKCVSIDILPCLSELNEERFQTNWPNRSYTIWFDWENQDFVQKLIQLIKKRRQSGLSLLIRLNDREWADWTLICRSRLIVAGNKVNNDGPIYRLIDSLSLLAMYLIYRREKASVAMETSNQAWVARVQLDAPNGRRSASWSTTTVTSIDIDIFFSLILIAMFFSLKILTKVEKSKEIEWLEDGVSWPTRQA